MTVRELKEKLANLPAGCDDYTVVTMRACIEPKFNGSEDSFTFTGFDEMTTERVIENHETKTVRLD